MKVSELIPLPTEKEPFRRSAMRFATEEPGCYALTTFDQEILYVGLASNLRRRMSQHLDTPEKVGATDYGRAIWFYWHRCKDLNKVERSWMNAYVLQHGVLPVLNKVYSGVSY
jgi:hypothetical protein